MSQRGAAGEAIERYRDECHNKIRSMHGVYLSVGVGMKPLDGCLRADRRPSHAEVGRADSGLDALAEKASRRIICKTVGVPSAVETIT